MSSESIEPAGKHSVYRPARQTRGVETERRFRDAAELCFGRYGYSGTKVSKIIEEAGCSTGSYYHRFKDKRALFDVMLAEYVESVDTLIKGWKVSVQETGGLRGLLRYVAEAFESVIQRFGGFLRAAQEVSLSEPETWSNIGNLTFVLWQKIERHLPEYLIEISAKDPKMAMRGAIQSILTLMLQAFLHIGQLFPKSSDDVKKLAIAAALGILQPGEE